MRQRTTFIHAPYDLFNSEQIQVKNVSIQVRSLKAAREDQWTVSFSELPQELLRVLKQCYEVHIRWTSPLPYPSLGPFVSRLPPGLYISLAPKHFHSVKLLCPLLRKVFGEHVNCASPEQSFVRLPLGSGRFATTAALLHYGVLPSLNDFVTYIQHKVCLPLHQSCLDGAELLRTASYLDVDYDAISQSLKLNSFHHASPPSGWTEDMSRVTSSATLEVGVLAPEMATDPESLSLGGFIATLGKDEKPSKSWSTVPNSLSNFHSTHALLISIKAPSLPTSTDSTYAAAFLHPTGLHPLLRLSFPSAPTPPNKECKLHTYCTLPSSIFVDQYALQQSNVLSSKNLRVMRSLFGETDLEAPEWVIQKWGSVMLLEISPNCHFGQLECGKWQTGSWHADIPLHLRYLQSVQDGINAVKIPWPIVFWACPAEEGTKMTNNPFDRTNLGYDGLFGPRTMFYHLTPQLAAGGNGTKTRLDEVLEVPVLNSDMVYNVELGTAMIVLLGVLWILGKLFKVLPKRGKRKER